MAGFVRAIAMDLDGTLVQDGRFLLISLVVVIVGGMGSITGTAVGAILIGLSEQIGLALFKAGRAEGEATARSRLS